MQPIINPLPFYFLVYATLFLKYIIKGALKPYTSNSDGFISSSYCNSFYFYDTFPSYSFISSNFFYL